MSIKTKRKLVSMAFILILIMSMLSPALTAFASLGLGPAETEFNEKTSEFIKDADEARDIIELLNKDAENNPRPDRNSISFVMKRLLYPNIYANDMRDGVLSRDIIFPKSDFLHDGNHACNPNAPNNLIDHNCNIPNFTTGLFQNIAQPFMSPLINAEKTSSYADFGLGVPANIPGDKVPINPDERKHTYTALELYGYNLQLTGYSGEWDQIVVSNSARMLSNFGVIDSITLAGTAIWNTVKEGVSTHISNFSFNPIRWYSNIAKNYDAPLSAGINTVIDTSELNIIATHAWKRPSIDSTLYNVYVMSDKEVLRETARGYFKTFSSELSLKANSSEKLKTVLAMDPSVALNGIEFVFDPEMETEESKKAREAAQSKRAEEEAHNAEERYIEKTQGEYNGEKYTPNIVPLTEVPEPVYYTESEQLGIWAKDPAVSGVISSASGEGLINGDVSSYETYEDLLSEWSTAYEPYFSSNFDAEGITITDLLEKTDAEVFQKYPHLDPKQGISKYACSNPDGSIMRDSGGYVEYLYLNNNKGSKEFLNPKCQKPRPPIEAGLFGNGWDNKEITDTRHISNVSGDTFIFDKLKNSMTGFIRSINSFIAKVTNVILSLSFKPILTELGIDEIIAKLVNSFRDTIFFPLAGIVVAVGGVMVIFQLLRNGSAIQLISSIALTILIFVVGTAFLLYPKATINLVDGLPSAIDNVVASAIIGGEKSSYCSTGEDVSGVRSAQCGVWGAMVFEPWVHLQFGTGYENLYANGKAPAGGKALQNTNESLVGDAAVNMGNGQIINNWALYQLDKTKSGTINQHDTKTLFGHLDKNMYRLVDLQAGPNNGAGTDSRYFETWSGARNGGFLLFLTTLQAIMMSLAIGSIAIAKIEVTFMFALSILFLPIMLLYALTPKGRPKLKGYVANLVSLLLKRAILVLMLSVLLRIIMSAYSKAANIEIGALMAIFISLAFLLYKKQLMNLIVNTESGIMNGDTGQVKEALGRMVPKYAKQEFEVFKDKTRGTVAGFTGGAIGAMNYKAELQARKAGVNMSLMMLNARKNLDEKELAKKQALEEEKEQIIRSIANRKELSDEQIEKLEQERNDALRSVTQLENEISKEYEEAKEEDREVDYEVIKNLRKEIEKQEKVADNKLLDIVGGQTEGDSIMSQAFKGANHSRKVIGRVAERRVRSQGYSGLSSYKDVKNTIYMQGAKEISDGEDTLAKDVYREMLAQSKGSKSKSVGKIGSEEIGQLQDPSVQKKVRKLVKERREEFEAEDFYSAQKDTRGLDLTDEMLKAAKIIDVKRKKQESIKFFKDPIQGVKDHTEKELLEKDENKFSSNTKDFVRRTEDGIKEGRLPDYIDSMSGKDVYIDSELSEDKARIEREKKSIEEQKEIAKELKDAQDKRRKLDNENKEEK